MAYIPTEWETGDIITAEKLNNIEDGIVANEEAIADALQEIVFSANYPESAPTSFVPTCNMTFSQAYTAMQNGAKAVLKLATGGDYLYIYLPDYAKATLLVQDELNGLLQFGGSQLGQGGSGSQQFSLDRYDVMWMVASGEADVLICHVNVTEY
jgi:hypothetical protein